ncbi:uncharacterized protein JN550_002535 [Neoarthrinium moseri]|uniref:uncharacterized protein n=1 Tax=Neoarthrinium moseri TaxID=1658444 RepID=UPI001FDB4B51|nr:uncharacterized protein JN550_002535 [Neoarthrinium moseri]KAI1875106.1 hypothetical protein JN550_002535 [Neoarthrinium moseri]
MQPFRTIRPAPSLPQGDELHAASPGGPQKGRRVSHACNECRKARAKCDGTRPRCNRCVSRDQPCSYVGSDGETRLGAAKNRLELLEKFVSSLRSSSNNEAARMLDLLKSGDDISSVLASMSVDGDDKPALRPPLSTNASNSSTKSSSSDSSGISSGGTSATSASSGTGSLKLPPLASGEFHRSSDSPLAASYQGDSPGSAARSAEPKQEMIYVPATDGSYIIALPDASDTAHAIQGFFRCSGHLFQVFSESQVWQMYRSVFDGDNEGTDEFCRNVCGLMAVAAVGAQYEHGNRDPQAKTIFYDIARHYFDLMLQENHLNAIKVSVMLTVYNVMDKATVALAYAEVGMGLSRLWGFPMANGADVMPKPAFWDESRRTWRTLVFLSSWLSSTLGYITGNGVVPQDEMPTIIQDLRRWYSRMPKEIRLDYEGRDSLPPGIKWSIYHVHLLYLGANILLYRRMVSQLLQTKSVDHGQGMLSRPFREVFDEHGEQALLAAKDSARILNLMLQEEGIFQRCWLVIFQAYTSGLIILHSAVQKKVRNLSPSSWEDDEGTARLCLEVLSYCAASDSTAARFCEELNPFYEYILQRDSTCFQGNPLMASRSNGDLESGANFATGSGTTASQSTSISHYELANPLSAPAHVLPDSAKYSSLILAKLCQPFGDPQCQGFKVGDVKERWRDEPTRQLHTLMIARLDWDFESRVPFQWDLGKLQKTSKVGSSINQLPLARMQSTDDFKRRPGYSFQGRYLGSETPNGWNSDEMEGVVRGT